MKIIVLVDIQNDFINGSLGSPEAQAIVPRVIDRIKKIDSDTIVYVTYDTHSDDYLETPEGKKLPVNHCIYGTFGWDMPLELEKITKELKARVFTKGTFGSVLLGEDLAWQVDNHNIESIEIMGLCTDICVISNALIIKAYCPDTPISVIADCCAGVTPEKHEAALEVMRSCQIEVI